jgi:hypothetical protein
MSPEGPRFPAELNAHESGDEKKNKRSKKGAAVRLPNGIVPVEKPFEGTQTKPAELSAIEKMLADLAAKRAETTSKPNEEIEKPVDRVEAPDEADSEDDPSMSEEDRINLKAVEPAPQESADVEQAYRSHDESSQAVVENDELTNEGDETYEPLSIRELEPVELSGGEVVIHLNGEGPVAERVILLQPETAEVSNQLEQHVEPPLRSQPMQQHLTREHSNAEPEAGTGSVPPPPPPERPEPMHMPEEPQRPELVTTYPPEAIRLRDMAPFAPSSEKPANKQDVEDALYYAEKAGQRRGLLTGLLVGGAYEHFKHKRREKKTEKRQKQQSRQLEEVRKDFAVREQEQAKHLTERDHQYNALEKRLENSITGEKPTKSIAEAPLLADEAEQMRIPEDHRLETSAWHSIEVDAKTGKPVENPTFQYGHEYYRERSHEATPTAHRNAAAGEVALVAAAIAGQEGSEQLPAPASLPIIPSATTQGPPSTSNQDEKDPATKSPKVPSTTGPIWPWVVTLVVIVLLLAILIR